MSTVTLTVEGRRLYVATPFGHSVVPALKELGAKWDRESKRWWVGVAKRVAVEAAIADATAIATDAADSPPAEEPDSSRCYSKVEYKGQNYFVVAESQAKGRYKVCKLHGPGFWVNAAECKVVKFYEPRTERSRYGRGSSRTVYTTLGSIRDFVERQKAAEERGDEPCVACGKRRPLILDHEDGGMKCHACCDIPSE